MQHINNKYNKMKISHAMHKLVRIVSMVLLLHIELSYIACSRHNNKISIYIPFVELIWIGRAANLRVKYV